MSNPSSRDSERNSYHVMRDHTGHMRSGVEEIDFGNNKRPRLAEHHHHFMIPQKLASLEVVQEPKDKNLFI
jgi:hypothetical protein